MPYGVGVRVPLSAQRSLFRGSFFVARSAQKEENRLYIIALQRFARKPPAETENIPQQTFRWQQGGQSPKSASEKGTATFLAHNALFCSVLPNNKVFLQTFY